MKSPLLLNPIRSLFFVVFYYFPTLALPFWMAFPFCPLRRRFSPVSLVADDVFFLTLTLP
jgi:hypothetical protein